MGSTSGSTLESTSMATWEKMCIKELGEQLKVQFKTQLGDQLWEQLGTQLGDQLWDQFVTQLGWQVLDQLKKEWE